MNKPQLTLAQVAGAVMRHKIKCFIVFTLVFSLVMGLFLVWPRKYGSEGTLHVQMTRTETNLSPVVTKDGQGMGISIQDTRETEIKSVEEILQSRAVLEAVVRKVGAEEILKSPFEGLFPSLTVPSFLKGKSTAGGLSPEEYKKLKSIERATNKLEKALTVHNMKKTSVISIYVKANSPRLAQQIVNQIIEEARIVHQKMHGVTGSSVFFAEKIDEAEKKLEQSLVDLEKFRKDRKVLSVGGARFSLQEIINSLEKDVVDTGVRVAQSQKKIDELKREIAKTPEKIVLETKGVERKSGDDATTEVFRLKSERQRLLAQYNPTHPEVRKIDTQLAKMRNILDSEVEDDRTQVQTAINKVYADVKVELVRAESENAGAKARLETLELRLAEAKRDAADLNRDEIETDRLQRQITDSRAERNMYVAKGREALASLSLDQSNLSTLVVAQQPTFILKHASPKGSMFLPIGMILGMLAGLATAMFCERNHLSPSLNETEVEQILEMPVLVTLPRVYSSRNMVN